MVGELEGDVDGAASEGDSLGVDVTGAFEGYCDGAREVTGLVVVGGVGLHDGGVGTELAVGSKMSCCSASSLAMSFASSEANRVSIKLLSLMGNKSIDCAPLLVKSSG